jgi:hypothetical protein
MHSPRSPISNLQAQAKQQDNSNNAFFAPSHVANSISPTPYPISFLRAVGVPSSFPVPIFLPAAYLRRRPCIPGSGALRAPDPDLHRCS